MRWLGTLGLGGALAAGVLWALLPPLPVPVSFASSGASAPPPGTRFSLFALGDTGDQHAWPSVTEGQLAVARALTAHDARAPVDALLLLGDNFYPDGLARADLVHRIQLNLVWPYCRFLALDGPRSAEVAEACSLPDALRRTPAPPVLAVLGNHDYDLPESASLQREAIPAFLPNWNVPPGPVDVVALAPGLSLVLVDDVMARQEGALDRITRTLRESPGPWRIVAAHRPIAERRNGLRGARRLREALQAADVPVQLFLSGHEHDLRVIEMGSPGPFLHVVAGGGSTRKPIANHYAGERFVKPATGFARIDLVESDGGEELQVSLYSTPRYPTAIWWESTFETRWSVTLDGTTRAVGESMPRRYTRPP